MDLVLLIFAVLILGKLKELRDNTELRVAAGGLLGAVYFFIWPFFYYWGSLLGWDEIYIQALLVLPVIVVFVGIRLFAKIKTLAVPVILSLLIFVSSWVLTDAYEIQIKDRIAEASGFLNGSYEFNDTLSTQSLKAYSLPDLGYSVAVPGQWFLKKTEYGNPYFVSSQPEKTIELRPRCYAKQVLPITDIVQGWSRNINGARGDHVCFKYIEHAVACKINTHDQSMSADRVVWVYFDMRSSDMFTLDFVFRPSGSSESELIDAVFKSVRLQDEDADKRQCSYPAAWI